MKPEDLAAAVRNSPPPPPPPPAPPTQKKLDPGAVGVYVGRINRAIVAISAVLKSQYRTTFDRFLMANSPNRANDFDNNLPVNLRRHARNKTRTTVPGFGGSLYFLAGNAITQMYAATRGEAVSDDLAAAVKALEEVAVNGPQNYTVDGTDAIGYTLVRKAK